jgi:DNA-binding CsgD family transcriptional regulator
MLENTALFPILELSGAVIEPMIGLLTSLTLEEARSRALELLSSIVDFDLYSVAIVVGGLTGDLTVPNKLVGFCGSFSRRFREAYQSYYFDKTPALAHSIAQNGLPYPVDCARLEDCEFTTDFLEPQGIRAFFADYYRDPCGSGLIYFAFNESAYSEPRIERNLGVLKSYHPLIEAILSLISRSCVGAKDQMDLGEGEQALSPRELDVGRLLAQRYTAAEISDRLGISRRTVETHIQHIYQKVGVTGRRAFLSTTGRA